MVWGDQNFSEKNWFPRTKISRTKIPVTDPLVYLFLKGLQHRKCLLALMNLHVGLPCLSGTPNGSKCKDCILSTSIIVINKHLSERLHLLHQGNQTGKKRKHSVSSSIYALTSKRWRQLQDEEKSIKEENKRIKNKNRTLIKEKRKLSVRK